jgi:hypothetical protein
LLGSGVGDFPEIMNIKELPFFLVTGASDVNWSKILLCSSK